MFTFSERLEEALSIRNMKPAELAKALNIADATISNYRSGKYEPKQKRLEQISNILNVSIPWLMGADVPMERGNLISLSPMPSTNKVPRLGRISCGDPIMSEENFDGFDEVPSYIHCDFSLTCEGDSMTGARINDGDIVYIKQQSTIDNGQIAAILVDGFEKLLKRVYLTENSITLQAENPAYPPRIFIGEEMNRVSIIGRAVAFTSIVR